MSMSETADSSWARLGAIAPSALADTRLELHHATQIIVSAAISYIPARPDDSHTALSWSAPRRALVTEPITARRTIRIGLGVEDLRLDLLDDGDDSLASYQLPGNTIAQASDWLATAIANEGLDQAGFTSRKHYTIPNHVVAAGSPFSTTASAERAELARYWSNAAGYLEALASGIPGASPVLTWPHHFDIATLTELPKTRSGKTPMIGVGMSPGDESYHEPYWYVGPNPRPDVSTAAKLDGGGRWHTVGWIGAALPASDFVDAPDQRAQVNAFMASAMKECRRLLEAQTA
jgi:hypothetical protein